MEILQDIQSDIDAIRISMVRASGRDIEKYEPGKWTNDSKKIQSSITRVARLLLAGSQHTACDLEIRKTEI